MTSAEPAPLHHFYDLADLSEAGDEVRISAGPEDLARLAQWAGVARMDRFEAVVTLERLAPNRFGYAAVLTADYEQSCVVSLEPVRTHLDRCFTRSLEFVSRARREPEGEVGGVLSLGAADDEAPEEIESLRYDVAGPLLEELSLSIDPYPRSEGVEFKLPEEAQEPRESPFAVLRRLKEGGS